MLSRIPIVIASLLKPVDDTRMFEKLGLSLAQKNKYQINIIGFYSKKNKNFSNIHVFPIFNVERFSLQRMLQPLKYLKILLKVKPEIIIVNSHDLLIVTLLYTLSTGTLFIYDVQENYYRNIIYNSYLPYLFRYLIASFVRLKEYVCHPFIDHYLIAETGYLYEMPYLKKKGFVLRNKYVDLYQIPVKKNHIRNKIKILYSGTIARAYGIFSIINFIAQFHNKYPSVELLITGYCPHKPALKKIKQLISDKPYIVLKGGDELVPHEQIIQEIQSSDFGIICYEINEAIKNCFPTRIYEYMGNRLPILIQDYKPWSEYCLRNHAGIEVDFKDSDFDRLITSMENTPFYSNGIPEDIYWIHEEPKLLALFDKITN